MDQTTIDIDTVIAESDVIVHPPVEVSLEDRIEVPTVVVPTVVVPTVVVPTVPEVPTVVVPTVPEVPTVVVPTVPEVSEIDQVFNHLKLILSGEQLNTANIISLSIALMKFVQRMTGVENIQKKYLVIAALKKSASLIEDEAKRDKILLIINTVLPTVIDSVISAANGLVVFDKAKEGILSKIFCCLRN